MSDSDVHTRRIRFRSDARTRMARERTAQPALPSAVHAAPYTPCQCRIRICCQSAPGNRRAYGPGLHEPASWAHGCTGPGKKSKLAGLRMGQAGLRKPVRVRHRHQKTSPQRSHPSLLCGHIRVPSAAISESAAVRTFKAKQTTRKRDLREGTLIRAPCATPL